MKKQSGMLNVEHRKPQSQDGRMKNNKKIEGQQYVWMRLVDTKCPRPETCCLRFRLQIWKTPFVPYDNACIRIGGGALQMNLWPYLCETNMASFERVAQSNTAACETREKIT